MKLILPVPFKIKVCVCSLFCVVISVNTLFAQSFVYPHFKIEKLAEGVYTAISTDGYSDCAALRQKQMSFDVRSLLITG